MKRGFESFGIFVDYAIVAIIELCVMENLTLSPSALHSKKERKNEAVKGGGGRQLPARSPSQNPRTLCKSSASNFATHPSAPRSITTLIHLCTNLNRIQGLWVLDKFVVVRELSLRQEVVERLGNVAVSIVGQGIY